MVGCSVFGCKSRSERNLAGLSFHRFPSLEKEVQLWTKACGRPNWKPSNNSRVCSIHFQPQTFTKHGNKTILEPFAVPTLMVPDFPDISIHGSSKRDHAKSVNKLDPETELKLSLAQTSAELNTFDKPVNVDTSIPAPSETNSHRKSALKRNLLFDMTNTPTRKKPKLERRDSSLAPTTTKRKLHIEEVNTPNVKKLKLELERKSELAENRLKKLRAVRQAYRRLNKRNAQLLEIITELQIKCLISCEEADVLSTIDTVNHDFLKRFLGLEGKTKKYSPSLRKFALCLHFISPRAYSYVREQFNTCLPHPQTLVSWYKSFDGNPGFTSESLETLKNRASAGHKIYACLSFDEMSIRKAITLSGNECFGSVNVGLNLEGDNIRMATQALVFMVTAVNGSWKMPVGYFLIDRISGEQKAELVKQCLTLLFDCNIEIISVTCDGCPTNFAMAKVLGCKIEGDEIHPMFKISVKDYIKEVCFFPDPPHMLKLLRNLLGDKGILKIDNEEISWKYLKLLDKLQQEEGLHLGNKLKKAHINVYRQIMKVKLAAQTFSNSVAEAIETCETELQLKEFQGASVTVDFIKKVNSLFDVLNSRNINAYGYKKPLNIHNYTQINAFLNEMLNYLGRLQLSDGQNVFESNRKACVVGFRCCIRSMQILYERLIADPNSDLTFLPSYKLSQDHLECFFSAIRSKGGFNNNPSPIKFRAAYKRLVVHGELKHINSGNCTPLENVNILTYSNTSYDKSINSSLAVLRHNDEDISDETDTDELIIDTDHDYLADPTRLTEFSKHVIAYIAGFVVRKITKTVKCENCLVSLVNTESKAKFKLVSKRDMGGLVYPTDDVVGVCEMAEKIFRRNVAQFGSKILDKKNVLLVMIHQCLKLCLRKQFFREHGLHFDHSPLEDHTILLLKSILSKYFTTRIHHYAKKITEPECKVRNMYTKLTLFRNQ